jgi:hypothetical protein
MGAHGADTTSNPPPAEAADLAAMRAACEARAAALSGAYDDTEVQADRAAIAAEALAACRS